MTRRSPGYWQNPENLRKEFDYWREQLGRTPTIPDLKARGQDGLCQAIHKYKGGFRKALEEWGYEAKEKPPRYWKKEENWRPALEGLIKEVGRFPSTNDFNDHGLSGLSSVLYDLPGGMDAIREEYGYERKLRPSGYWHNWENVKSEVETLAEKLGHFPTGEELIEHDMSALKNASPKIKKKLHKLAQELNLKRRKPTGYWENYDNIKKEVKRVVKEHGRLPTEQELRRMGESGLVGAVRNNTKGFNAILTDLKIDLPRTPPNYWKNWENIKTLFSKINDDFGYIPGVGKLRKLGYALPTAALKEYHGGMQACRERFYEETGGSEKDTLERLLSDYAQGRR